MSRKYFAIALGTILLASPLTIAQAVSPQGAEPPATWVYDPEVYQGLFNVAPEWQPQGTVLVDSGFRPYPNGFPFSNYGGDFEENQFVYGLPERVPVPAPKKWKALEPAELNALALRRTFGDGVCMVGSKIDAQGNCQLTRSAEVLAEAISAQAAGGHCFGMAATVAALFNGQINPNQIGSQVLPSTNNLNTQAQRTILRLFGSQFFGGTSKLLGETPNDVVNILRRDLAAGTVPYILTLMGPDGGHGITPFAVLEREDGIIEIAVYDNNFPNLTRVVLVDPVANTFVYSGAINPSADPLLWQGNNVEGASLNLVSVDATLEQLSCPVCIGPDQGTFIAAAAVEKVNKGLTFDLLNLDGTPLSDQDFRTLSPLNPPSGKEISLPMVLVNPGVSYRLVVDGRAMVKPEPLELYVMANGKTSILIDEFFKPGTVAQFVINSGARQSAYQSTQRSSPRVQEAVEVKEASLVLNGHIEALPAGRVASQQTNPKTGVTTFRSNSKTDERWNIQATYEGLKREVSYVALDVDITGKDSLVLKYLKWDGTSAPQLWVDKGDDGKLDRMIEMQLVTPEFIEKTKSQIYVSKGL